MKDNELLTLTLERKNMNLVSRALDLYCRLSIGQFRYSTDCHTVQQKVWNMSQENRDEFEECMLRAGELMTGIKRHGSYGIHNEEVMDDAREAAHIHQAIRHHDWLQQPIEKRQRFTVNAYPADLVKGLKVDIQTQKESATIEDYKKLLRMANVPEILIENPQLIRSLPVTDEDFNWAKEQIDKKKNETIKD